MSSSPGRIETVRDAGLVGLLVLVVSVAAGAGIVCFMNLLDRRAEAQRGAFGPIPGDLRGPGVFIRVSGNLEVRSGNVDTPWLIANGCNAKLEMMYDVYCATVTPATGRGSGSVENDTDGVVSTGVICRDGQEIRADRGWALLILPRNRNLPVLGTSVSGILRREG